MTDEPISPDKIRHQIQVYAGQDEPTEYDSSKWGAMIGWLNKMLITDYLRRLVLGWLMAYPEQPFEPLSSSKLTPQQKHGIAKWVGTWFNEDLQAWATRPTFEQECLSVLNAARYDYQTVTGKPAEDLPFEVDGKPAGVVTELIEDELDPLWNPENGQDLEALAPAPRKVKGFAI